MLAAAWLPLALASSSEPDAPLTLGDRMEAAALERRRHGETHRVVILTMLADDYAPLHDQMMCSLKRLNLSSHVVIATDKKSTCDNLLPEWRAQGFELDPGMLTKEASYQGLEARESRDWDEFQLRAGFDTEPDASGNRTELAVPYDYGSAGFRRIAQMKPLLTRVGNLRGLDVLFTDGDIVFVSDPIHDLYSHRSDLVVQDDAVSPPPFREVSRNCLPPRAAGEFLQGVVLVSARSSLAEVARSPGPPRQAKRERSA